MPKNFSCLRVFIVISIFHLACAVQAKIEIERGEVLSKRNVLAAIHKLERYEPIPSDELSHYRQGQTLYMATTYIRPGQEFFSFYNLRAKVFKRIQAVDGVSTVPPSAFKFRGNFTRYLLYNNHTSFLPMSDPAVGVLVKRWSERDETYIHSIILAGHNHHHLAGLLMGARTIPVHIVADLRYLDSWSDTLHELKRHYWIDEEDLDGRVVETKKFSHMTETNLRSVTDAVAFKVIMREDDTVERIQKPKVEYPVFIKYNGGKLEATFDANQVARELHRCGLNFEIDTFHERLTPQQVETIRTCLAQARMRDPERLAVLDLLEHATSMQNLDLDLLVRNRLGRVNACADRVFLTQALPVQIEKP